MHKKEEDWSVLTFPLRQGAPLQNRIDLMLPYFVLLVRLSRFETAKTSNHKTKQKTFRKTFWFFGPRCLEDELK